jgi:ABC transporter substrate binding protein
VGHEPLFAELVRDRVAALIIVTDPFLAAHRGQILRLAAANRIPTIAGVRYFVEPGGLMYYGPNFFDPFRRAAYFVDKILKGAKPGDLPVEQPTKFELVINLKTAKTLGLTIPPSLLLRANQVIEWVSRFQRRRIEMQTLLAGAQRLLAPEPDFPRVQDGVRLLEDVLEQAQLVEEMRGAGLQHLAAKLPVEVLVPFQHQHLGAPLGEQEPQPHPGGPAAHDADVRPYDRRHAGAEARRRHRRGVIHHRGLRLLA